MGLETEIAAIESIERDVDRLASEANTRMVALQERIRNGESTGNSARDYVVVHNGTLNPAAVKPYEELQAQLRGKEGAPLLLVRQSQYPLMAYMMGIHPPEESATRIITNLKLGILDAGFKLDPTTAEITLPLRDRRYAERHAEYQEHHKWFEGQEHHKWFSYEGNIILYEYEVSSSGQATAVRPPIEDGLMGLLGGPSVLGSQWELRVGDKVAEYFRRDGRLDISYVRALRLLGIGMQAPADFQRAYRERRETERLTILRDLEDLDAQERMLRRKALKGTTESAGELERTRERIRGLLKEAIDLGFHQEDFTLPASTPGAEINVRRFLTELITAHEVDDSPASKKLRAS